MANKKPKNKWVETALAGYEKDRKRKGLSEDEYYFDKLNELIDELPEKPFGTHLRQAKEKTFEPTKRVQTKVIHSTRQVSVRY